MAAASKAQRRYGNPPKRPSKALKDAAAAGRGGDSMLAHIGPQEAAALKAMGGAGTVNPETGLLEFAATDAGADPGAKGAGTAAGGGNTSVGADPGAKGGGTGVAGGTSGGAAGDLRSDGTAAVGSTTAMGDHPRPDLAGGSTVASGGTTLGNSTDLRGPTTAEKKGDGTATGGLTAPAPSLNTLPPGTAGTTPTPNFDALAAAPTGLTPGKYVQAAANMGTAYADYKNYNNTMMEDVGNFLASMAGFNEINPTKEPIGNFVKQDQADWGFDPAGLIGSAVGSAAGLPFGGGLTVDLISRALGRPLEINLGPDVGALAGVGSESRAERRYGGKQA